MVEPTDFFVAIIQASAGLLGVIIAVSTVIYSLDIQMRIPRTRDLHEELQEYKSEYRRPLTLILKALSEERDGGYIADFSGSKLNAQYIIDNSDSHRKVDVVAAHSYRAWDALKDDHLNSHYSLRTQEVENLIESVRKLRAIMFDDGEKVYRDITGKDSSDADNYFTESILNDLNATAQLAALMTQRYASNRPTEDGSNLNTLSVLFTDMASDSYSISNALQSTTLDYKPPLRGIVLGVLALAGVGVFVPSLFLLHPPQSVDPVLSTNSWVFFLLQAGILVSVVALTVGLALLLLKQMQGKDDTILGILHRALLGD